MFGLSVTATAIILAIVLAVLGLAYLLFGWLRKRSWRVLLRGAGFMLMPIGLLSMGLMNKIVDGLNAVVNWAQTTYMNGWIGLGLGLAGLGLAAWLVGSFVPPVTGEEAAKRRQAINDRKLAALQAGRRAAPAPAPAPVVPGEENTAPAITPAAPNPAPETLTMSDDDKEVDEILRRHGIN